MKKTLIAFAVSFAFAGAAMAADTAAPAAGAEHAAPAMGKEETMKTETTKTETSTKKMKRAKHHKGHTAGKTAEGTPAAAEGAAKQ